MIGWLLFFMTNYSFAIDFSAIPAANSLEESKAQFMGRVNTIAEYSAHIPAGVFNRQHNGRFLSTAIARLYLHLDVSEINSVLEDPKTIAYSKWGTDMVFVPKICQRTGDYDFSLIDLISVAYLGKNALSSNAKYRLLNVLLSAKGDNHFTHFWLGACGRYKDSENHILMTETSRYLTNQLIKNKYAPHKADKDYDNAKNGFPTWMVKHLQQFFTEGFKEFNSRPYEYYSSRAITNLMDFAEDKNVQLTAHSLLDLISATYAIQSNGLRRLPPWRRQPHYMGRNKFHEGDGGLDRFIILAGNYHFFSTLEKPFDYPLAEVSALPVSPRSYRVPDLILDLMITAEHRKYFQIFRHMGAEIYSSSPSALISSGGTYINNFDFATKERDGLPTPITLMLTRDVSSDIRNWFRIEGHKELKYRNNLCVNRNFACGVNVRIPSYIPLSCQEKIGDWTLFNFSSPDCLYHYGVHVAVLSRKADSSKCQKAGDNFGLIEVREASELSYQQFKTKILNNNANAVSCEKKSHYVTSSGQNVEFELMPTKNNIYPIVAFDNRTFERDYKKWKRASGDIVNSSNDGKTFEIKNPSLRQKLTIDVTNPVAPKRTLISY